jgi:translation elongation factor EF-G
MQSAVTATENAAAAIARGLNIGTNSAECRTTVQAIFRAWLPLSDAILRMVVRCVPDPRKSQKAKTNNLFDKVTIEGEFPQYIHGNMHNSLLYHVTYLTVYPSMWQIK